jgi:hypothetical protein
MHSERGPEKTIAIGSPTSGTKRPEALRNHKQLGKYANPTMTEEPGTPMHAQRRMKMSGPLAQFA